MSSGSGNFDLNGWPVWFDKFGTGNDVVLLIPGAMGEKDLSIDKILITTYVYFKEPEEAISRNSWKGPTVSIWRDIRSLR